MTRLKYEKGAIDAIDAQILEALTDDARISVAELARTVGLSSPSVSERVKRLEDEGHDPADWKAACEKAMVWGDTIYTGLFFQTGETPTLHKVEPVLDEGGALGRRSLGLTREQGEQVVKRMM